MGDDIDIGDGVWLMQQADGTWEFRIASSQAELARLNGEARQCGFSLGELLRRRLLGSDRDADLLLWPALCLIAQQQNSSVEELCADIAEAKPPTMPMMHAVRSYVVGHFAEKLAGNPFWRALLGGTRH